MALDLEKLRKAAAEAKGEAYVSGEPELEGLAKKVWEERKVLQKELDGLKAHSDGQDEIHGTPEYMRVQEIGLALKQAESRLAELGVVIPDKLEALRKAVGEVAEKDTDNEAERFREHIEMIVADLKRAGDSFLDTSERFVRFVEGRAPYRSKLGDELVATEQFQIILAANREAPEVFRELIKLKESEVSSETISVVELKLQMKVSLEKLQLIFTKTEQDATELWGTVTREYRKMSQEYRSGTQAQDEEEYLMSVGSLLRVVCEESERMENTIRTALLENS